MGYRRREAGWRPIDRPVRALAQAMSLFAGRLGGYRGRRGPGEQDAAGKESVAGRAAGPFVAGSQLAPQLLGQIVYLQFGPAAVVGQVEGRQPLLRLGGRRLLIGASGRLLSRGADHSPVPAASLSATSRCTSRTSLDQLAAETSCLSTSYG